MKTSTLNTALRDSNNPGIYLLLMITMISWGCKQKPIMTDPAPTIINVTNPADSIALAQLRDSIRMNSRPAAGKFAAVTLDNMDVLYIGVNNPLTIEVAGFDPADLSVSISGGTITNTETAGKYFIRVTRVEETTLSISAKNGVNLEPVATKRFRIKRLPDPVCFVGNISGDGIMHKSEVANLRGVFAKTMDPDFDVKFNVVSFVLSVNVNGVYVENRASGPGITADMSRLLSSIRPGEKVIFEQVMVQGPDGGLRKIPGVNIKVR